jgi:hypothetical protein
VQELPLMTKEEVADRVLDRALELRAYARPGRLSRARRSQ